MNSSLTPPCIGADPDISGIGVRAAIYIQNVLGFVPAISAVWDGRVASYELEAVETQSTTMLITAFGVLISSMIQAHTQILDNFHATIVLSLSWMSNTNTFIYFLLYIQRRSQLGPHQLRSDISTLWRCVKAWLCCCGGFDALWGDKGPNRQKVRRFSQQSDRSNTSEDDTGANSGQRSLLAAIFNVNINGLTAVAILGSLHLSLMSYFGIWLWRNPATFGSANNADPCALHWTSYIILGKGIPLKSRTLRIVSLIIYATFLTPVFNILLPMVGALTLLLPYGVYHRARYADSFDPSSSSEKRHDALRSMQDPTKIASSRSKRAPAASPWTLHVGYNPFLLPVFAGLVVLFAINVAFIVDIELTLHHNRPFLKPGESGWSFGQTLAILFLLLPLRDLRIFNARRDFTSSLRNAVLWKASTEILRDLVRRGADVNVRVHDAEFPAVLLLAVSRSDVDFTRMLLVYGANPNVRDDTGTTPLQAASSRESLDVIKLLLANNADPNIEGGKYGSALQAAAYSGNIEILRLLLEHGADVNFEGGRYGTALQAASDRGFNDVVELLRARGATR
ncbi:hypothetical protein B0H19DRAFT_1203019 [Mycena capillaripes]|nr:hypothetical protein B0H19DRAFT_1203019 [Mycena capillaripes]